METPQMKLTQEELDTAIAWITNTYKVTAAQLEYVDATHCSWKNDKAMIVTFHDTIVKTSRSAKLYW